MRRLSILAALAVFSCVIIRAADWPALAGGPQRNGWARSERTINPANVSQLQLLYKFQAANQSRPRSSLTAPIVDGNLITYLGFKEMLVFGSSSGKVFSRDADLNKPLWEAQLGYKSEVP